MSNHAGWRSTLGCSNTELQFSFSADTFSVLLGWHVMTKLWVLGAKLLKRSATITWVNALLVDEMSSPKNLWHNPQKRISLPNIAWVILVEINEASCLLWHIYNWAWTIRNNISTCRNSKCQFLLEMQWIAINNLPWCVNKTVNID